MALLIKEDDLQCLREVKSNSTFFRLTEISRPLHLLGLFLLPSKNGESTTQLKVMKKALVNKLKKPESTKTQLADHKPKIMSRLPYKVILERVTFDYKSYPNLSQPIASLDYSIFFKILNKSYSPLFFFQSYLINKDILFLYSMRKFIKLCIYQ